MRLSWAVAVLMLSTTWTSGQDAPSNLEELNRKYQDALAQLKTAQDRKNELATENEKLSARIAELEKQADEHKRVQATFAEQTYRLRMHYAAWEAFLKRQPHFLEKWKQFLERNPLAAPATLPEMDDPRGLGTE